MSLKSMFNTKKEFDGPIPNKARYRQTDKITKQLDFPR